MPADDPALFRCANCHWVYEVVPLRCDHCKTTEFEPYRRWISGITPAKGLLIASLAVVYFYIFNPWTKPDYGPIYLVLLGGAELMWLGILESAILIPVILSPLFLRGKVPLVLAGMALFLWWAQSTIISMSLAA
jgi:hypothetical protein